MNEKTRALLEEAERLIRLAWNAHSKMGLRDRGSDCRLSHEVRMFALDFSQEGREGPGVLQITGTGRMHKWLKSCRKALKEPRP